MEFLKTGTENVEKIINRKMLSHEASYRISMYTFFYEENNRHLIRNTLTNAVADLTDSEWEGIRRLREQPQPYDLLAEKGLIELAKQRYIVETDYDEVKEYQKVVFLLKTMSGQKKGLESYIIFPTTGCNARCVYCYEEGYAIKTMTPETADRLVQFICETRHDAPITLHWFGGEPLVGVNNIRRICMGLQERGIPFKSSMVTNASLMTKALAHEAKTVWNLTKVQVSLDGVREDYTPRKNYIDPDKYNYDVVMQAIQDLADEGIHVNLRVNVDFENVERIGMFLDEMQERFGENEKVTLYLAPLFQEKHGERCIDLYKRILSFAEQVRAVGGTSKHRRKIKFRVNYCMADSMDKSIVITPDGKFNNCEHLPESQTWGNIFDGVTNQARFDELKAPMPVDERCARCPFLPKCTPFYKNGCPGWFEKCYEYQCLAAEHSLHSLLNGTESEMTDDTEEL